MAELITVMAAKADDKVVIWETNPDHPNGEIFISGDGTSSQVALTPAVQHRLDNRTLVKVQGERNDPTDAEKQNAERVEADRLEAERKATDAEAETARIEAERQAAAKEEVSKKGKSA